MFFWTILYLHSVIAAPTWLATPLSQNLNWLSGKFQRPTEFLSFNLLKEFTEFLQVTLLVLLDFVKRRIHEKI